jgi:hypothetical protein
LEGGGQTQHAARSTARVVFPSRVDGVIRRLPLIEIRVKAELPRSCRQVNRKA